MKEPRSGTDRLKVFSEHSLLWGFLCFLDLTKVLFKCLILALFQVSLMARNFFGLILGIFIASESYFFCFLN